MAIVFTPDARHLVMHNAMFDLMWLYAEHPYLRDRVKSGDLAIHCTYIASLIAWPFEPSHSLKALAVRRTAQTNRENLGAEDFHINGVVRPEWADRMDTYLRRDVEDTIALWNHPDIQKAILTPKYRHCMYAMVAAAELRFNGERIDLDMAAELSVPLIEQIGWAQGKLAHELSRLDPSIVWFNKKGSFAVKRFRYLLFHALKLPVIRRTKTGLEGIGADDIEQILLLHPDHPILTPYAKWKKTRKLKEDYIDRFVKKCDSNNRIHPNIRLAPVTISRGLGTDKTGSPGSEGGNEGPATGRWSKTNPPRDQIPRSGGAVNVRPMFIPGEGNAFVTVDVSQMEHFIGCMLSGDQNLMEYALDPSKDIHQWTADLVTSVWGCDPCPRQCGKGIVYSSWFGAMEPKVLEIIRGFHNPKYLESAANEVYTVWHAEFPGIRAYQIATLQACRANNMIATTRCGHDRVMDIVLPRIRSDTEFRWALEVQGSKSILNHEIQTLGAKLGQSLLVEGCRAYPDAKLVNATHDSGSWEIALDKAENMLYTFSERVMPAVGRHMQDIGWTDMSHTPGIDIQTETRWYAGDLIAPVSCSPLALDPLTPKE